MKMLVQIVENAELSVDGELISAINNGYVVYFCVEKGDKEEDLNYFARRIALMRINQDENGKTNLSIKDTGGEVLLISQFTLAGDFKSKLRPDFTNAESYDRAKSMYEKLAQILREEYSLSVKLGVFGAHMIVKQTGVGPFSAIIDGVK